MTTPTLEKALAVANGEENNLGIKLGDKAVQNGDHVVWKDTLGVDKPSLFLTEADPKQTYLALTLDLEAPYPSASLLSPLLHWMQPGLKAGSIVEAWPLNSEEPALASFIPATPPPFSGPHKYLTLLYKQPEGFDPKEFGSMVTGRVKFDFEGFVDEAKLGDDSLVAAHHFLSN